MNRVAYWQSQWVIMQNCHCTRLQTFRLILAPQGQDLFGSLSIKDCHWRLPSSKVTQVVKFQLYVLIQKKILSMRGLILIIVALSTIAIQSHQQPVVSSQYKRVQVEITSWNSVQLKANRMGIMKRQAFVYMVHMKQSESNHIIFE